MSVELGALSLLIRAPGGKETVDTLHQVDRTAKHTATAWEEAWRGVGKETGKLKQNLSELLNPLTAVKTAVGALAAAFAVEKVGEFLGETIAEANAGARALAQLSLAVRNAGGDFASWRGTLDDSAERLSALAGVSVPDVRKALAVLITTTHDVAASQRALGAVADFAAAKQLPLAEAAEIVGRAMAGQTQILQHLGVRVHDVTTVVADVGRTFKDAATEGLSPFERAQRAAAVEMGNLKEAIGDALLATGDAKRGVDAWSGALQAATRWVQAHHHEIGALVTGLRNVVGGVADLVGWMADHGPLVKALAASTTAVYLLTKGVVALSAAMAVSAGTAIPGWLAKLRLLGAFFTSGIGLMILSFAGAIGAVAYAFEKEQEPIRQYTAAVQGAVAALSPDEARAALREVEAERARLMAAVRETANQPGDDAATVAAHNARNAQLSRTIQLLDLQADALRQVAGAAAEANGAGTGGTPTPTGTRSQAQVDALRAQIQAELALTTERNAAAQALNEQQYAQGLQGLEAYGARRVALVAQQSAAVLGALQRERAAVQSLRTVTGDDEAQKQKALAELDGKLAVQRVKGLEDERAAVEALRAARKTLAEATSADRQREAALTGSTRAAAEAAIASELNAYRELLRQQGKVGDEYVALLAKRRALLTDRADFEDAKRQAEQTLAEVATLRTTLDAQVKAGLITQLDADRQVAQAERDRLPALRLLADLMAKFAEKLKDPALKQAAADLNAQLAGAGQDPTKGYVQRFTQALEQAEREGTPTMQAVVARINAELAKAGQVTPSLAGWAESLVQMAADVEQEFTSFGPRLGGVLGDTLGAAFSGGLKNAGTTLLKGLGAIFSQMGQKLLVFGLTMLKLLPAFSNPLTSGPAAILAGTALIALGATLGAIATGKGGGPGGGGAAAASQDASVARITLGSGYAANPRQVSGPDLAGVGAYGAYRGPAGALPAGADLVGRVAVAGPSAAPPLPPPRPFSPNILVIGTNDYAAISKINEIYQNGLRVGLFRRDT